MSMETGFTALRSHWRSLVDVAIKAKGQWTRDADECMSYFSGPHNFFNGDPSGVSSGAFMFTGKKGMPHVSIAMSINKLAEGVQLFGPSLYYKNPVCTVQPRKGPEIPLAMFGDQNDPQVQQQVQPILKQISDQSMIDTLRSILLHSYLNYLPEAINLKQNSRAAIDEAIITGGGVLWAKMDHPAGGRKMPILELDSIRHLIIDPDHKSLENARWVGRMFVKPVWEVEAEKGLKPDTLKGNYESHRMSAAVEAVGNEWKKQNGKTSDLLVYWGIWSKMGLGGLLKGINDEAKAVDRFGQYVYVEVCDSYNYFLNAPEEIWDNEEEVRRRVQWETPFWHDVPSTNGWPFEMFAFHRVMGQIWPMSHFRPALGELQFMNWGYSFLISAIQKRCRDFIVVAKSIDEETKAKILEGPDLTMIEFSSQLGMKHEEMVGFLRHPDFQDGIFKVLEKVEYNFDKRTGMMPLMYGEQHTQDRSATETKSKENFTNVRPDDMANCVEDTMTNCFRKLGLMSRWHMSGDDIGAVFGPFIGQLWAKHVATADIEQIIHQLEYRIEAGSAKKPNKSKDQDDANNLMQTMFPMLSKFASDTGKVDQVNALIEFWGNAQDMDVEKMLLPQPDPPQPPTPEPPKTSVTLNGEAITALGIGEAIRATFGLKGPPPETADTQGQDYMHAEAEHEQDMRHTDELHKLKKKHEKEKAAVQKKKALSNGRN